MIDNFRQVISFGFYQNNFMPSKGKKYLHYIGKKESADYVKIWDGINQLLKFKNPTKYFRIGYDYHTCTSIVQQHLLQLEKYRAVSQRTGIKVQLEDGRTKRIDWGSKFWWLYEYDYDVNKILAKFQITKDDEFVVYQKGKNIEIDKILSNKDYENIHAKVVRKWLVPQRYYKHQKFYIVPLTGKQFKIYQQSKQPFVFLAGRTAEYTPYKEMMNMDFIKKSLPNQNR